MIQASPRTILVVDDSPEDRAMVRRLLRQDGLPFALVEAGEGEEGLRLLRSERPDVVLLDFHLPDLDAPEFIDAMRLRGTGTGPLPVPVVLLTGQEDQRSAVTTLNQGAQDYVIKGTLTAHGLARVIENAIEKYQIQRELEEKTEALEARNAELETVRGVLQARVVDLATATRAKDQFLAVMSHEMRTPLNAILGYVDLLEMGIGGELREGQRPHIERIRVGSRHLLELINDVLDLAKADARMLELDPRPVDLQAVLEEVAALLEARAQVQGIELRVEPCGSAMPHVMADLQRLRQILVNLVGNALKFTDEGSVVVRCVPGDDGMVRIAVADTGIGISPEILPLVFNEFYQADGELTRSHGGSGLGLAISQRLAHLMGGSIHVESKLGMGSVFTLSIPAAHTGSELRADDVERHGARMAVEEISRPPRESREPVVVVAFGPHPESLAQLEERVQPKVRLVWTANAAEVPETARRERASLVVLDMGGGAPAWNAAYALRDVPELSATAVLLLPSIPDESSGDASGGLDLGWVSLVPKPFTAAQLARAVSTAVGGGQEPGEETGDITRCDVLIVDDDADSRRVAAKFLTAAGVTVREAPDGETALEDMRRFPPDVVVLDLMMPVLDGFGVLATMRADPLLSSIPVVVLSAKSLTDAERQFLARTASRVLQKGEHRLADVAALVLRAAAGGTRAPASPGDESGG